jgi:cyanate permease
MSLGGKLAIVFCAFLAVLATVIWMSFRERRLSKEIADDDIPAQQAQDARVMTIVFSAILGGMLLTVLVAWLVFF